MNFGEAVEEMRKGEVMMRIEWPAGYRLRLTLFPPPTALPAYFLLETPEAGVGPWTPYHVDLLASDWRVWC